MAQFTIVFSCVFCVRMHGNAAWFIPRTQSSSQRYRHIEKNGAIFTDDGFLNSPLSESFVLTWAEDLAGFLFNKT